MVHRNLDNTPIALKPCDTQEENKEPFATGVLEPKHELECSASSSYKHADMT